MAVHLTRAAAPAAGAQAGVTPAAPTVVRSATDIHTAPHGRNCQKGTCPHHIKSTEKYIGMYS